MVGWEFGHLFCVSGTDDVTEQKNNSLETIPSRFSLNRKQRSLLLSCFALRNLCPVHEVLSGIWNPLISGQIVNSFGQGKCTFDCQSRNLKNYPSGAHVSTSPCTLRTETLITVNISCIWTFHTNSLLHEYLFLMHVHNYMQLTINTFIKLMIQYLLQG